MPKTVTYDAPAIQDSLQLIFYLGPGSTIDERARCRVKVVATPDDPNVPALELTIELADLGNLSTFTGADWTDLKQLLAKTRNAAYAAVGL